MKNKNQVITILISFFFLTSFNPAKSSDSQYLNSLKTDNNFAKADAEMTKVYKQILKEYSSDKEFITKLVIAQNAWIKYRDSHLESLYPKKDKRSNYGSVYPECYSLNMASITQERTQHLKKWLIGYEEGEVCSGSVKIKN